MWLTFIYLCSFSIYWVNIGVRVLECEIVELILVIERAINYNRIISCKPMNMFCSIEIKICLSRSFFFASTTSHTCSSFFYFFFYLTGATFYAWGCVPVYWRFYTANLKFNFNTMNNFEWFYYNLHIIYFIFVNTSFFLFHFCHHHYQTQCVLCVYVGEK